MVGSGHDGICPQTLANDVQDEIQSSLRRCQDGNWIFLCDGKTVDDNEKDPCS
jgi:hypothetical protein